MKRIVHILKEPSDAGALAIIEGQQRKRGIQLILVQEAVGLKPALPPESVFVLRDDAAERNVEPAFKAIGYTELLNLILEADEVVTW